MDLAADGDNRGVESILSAVHPESGLHERIERALGEVDLESLSLDGNDTAYTSRPTSLLYRMTFVLGGGCALALLLRRAVRDDSARRSDD